MWRSTVCLRRITTLRASTGGVYYVMIRDYNYADATFTVTMSKSRPTGQRDVRLSKPLLSTRVTINSQADARQHGGSRPHSRIESRFRDGSTLS